MASYLAHTLEFWGYDGELKVPATRSCSSVTCMEVAFIFNIQPG
jgi:hypothetical protein